MPTGVPIRVANSDISRLPKMALARPPPPGSDGGLANEIFGSLLMSLLATLIGTPVGILAGTYVAEYGRRGWLGPATRFINDILLSAPSIVIGLFVYAIYVAIVQHFSGWAGTFALSLIVIPGGAENHRKHAAAGARQHARSRGRTGRAAMDRHIVRDPARRARRHHYRRTAGGRASAAKPPRCCSLRSITSSGPPTWTRRWPTCRSSSSSSP